MTDNTYVGKNGYSLRLDGLDKGFNDRARERAIVMHGAPYVSQAFVKTTGRLGRSWGCPAVSADVAQQMIDRVKGGGLVFAYYPDAEWLKTLEVSRGLPDITAFERALELRERRRLRQQRRAALVDALLGFRAPP